MELSGSSIKKFHIFSRKKSFLIFQETETPQKFISFPQKKAFPIFRETETPKKFFIFYKMELFNISRRDFPRSKIFYTFYYKESKFSKLKYFLIIITSHFSSFYNIFFYTQQAFVFRLLRDFCNVHDHIVTCFLFLL